MMEDWILSVQFWPSSAYILYQPSSPENKWNFLKIGSIKPDRLVSIAATDIDADGDIDIFSGSYSLGSRDKDDNDSLNRSYGSVVWFENTASGWKKKIISQEEKENV